MAEENGLSIKQMADVLEYMPGGLAVYQYDGERISPLFHNSAFYEIMGYSPENIVSTRQETTFLNVHPQDVETLRQKTAALFHGEGMLDHTYRVWNDVKGEYRWIRLESAVNAAGEESRLVFCVYSDVGKQKEMEQELTNANEKMQNIINAIPGGVVIYKVSEVIETIFFSDGLPEMTGHTVKEYQELVKRDAMEMVCREDREMVAEIARDVIRTRGMKVFEFRRQHKKGHIVWVNVHMKWIGEEEGQPLIHCVFHNISAFKAAGLFQLMANETADGIYVIDKRNYELLYANESGDANLRTFNHPGKKCYQALVGRDEPCRRCTLNCGGMDGEEQEVRIDGTDRFYTKRYRELDWNGIPACVIFVRDVTEEVRNRREKERLEGYFRMVVEQLPGGIAVIHRQDERTLNPEFISDGLAAMLKMTVKEIKELYCADILAGVHPDDIEINRQLLKSYTEAAQGHCELTCRMKRGDERYIWVKLLLSLREGMDGVRRLFAVYTDITQNMEEKELLRTQYEEQIHRHHHRPGPDVLVTGHCSISQNKILEISDYTESNLIGNFGDIREGFFRGIAGLIADEEEQNKFLNMFLNAPLLAAYEKREMEQILQCFVKLPGKEEGRYVQFKVNLVEEPDTNDITGILTVTDITEKLIAGRILHQLSMRGHDVVIDLNLKYDTYRVLTSSHSACYYTRSNGSLSERVEFMLGNAVVPRDREQYARGMDTSEMRRRLEKEDYYTFSYSLTDENRDVRTKSITISYIDRRLERACLVCTDITESVREQQGLLNMIAYTFELAGFININGGRFTIYTRQTVLENLPPYIIEDYDCSMGNFTNAYLVPEEGKNVGEEFRIETMVRRLGEEPGGYDFVFSYKSQDGPRYKQVNVLWGDQNHRTICMVRADVTDMLAAERQSKERLEEALRLAEAANVAKSDFLSAMSHDIRTPMNAIMGMTTLASIHLEDRERVADCLQKISVASRHLLSLINDVLDMSRIERSKITLNTAEISLPQLIGQITDIIEAQAGDGGLSFRVSSSGIVHPFFYGDSLRISQVLLNLLSNGVKFTPKGGTVSLRAEEGAPVKHGEGWARYRFIVSDTGIGMTEETLTEIFAPFMRSTGVERIEGTGLGLSITKGLVDLMDGEISVESRVGQGSEFVVELECRTLQDTKEVPESLKHEDGGFRSGKEFSDCCFLVAEDNAINAEILCEMLALYGAKTIVKTNGVQTVDEFARAAPGTYDAVLMDIQMPEMNGYEATRRIRKMERKDAGHIPVVAMTANAFSEDIQASEEAGMTAHVSKPVDMTVLRDTLARVLEISRKERDHD